MFDVAAFPFTTALLAANLVLSGYAWTTPGQTDNLVLNTSAVLRHRQYHRILTSGFIHADPFHFFFNMFTLYHFGPTLESVLGPIGYLVLYFGSLFASSALSLYHNRHDPMYSSLGASGAISGVLCAFCLFFPMAKIYMFFLPTGVPAFLFAGLYILISLYLMGDGDSVRRGGIAHEAHLGGAVAGMLFAAVLAWDRLFFI